MRIYINASVEIRSTKPTVEQNQANRNFECIAWDMLYFTTFVKPSISRER